VALVREIDPTAVMTARSLAAQLVALPGGRFVAEADGEIVGWAAVFQRADGAASFWVGVLPALRRKGVGSELFLALSDQLDGASSRAYADGEDGGRFLTARGYAPVGKLNLQTLDLAAVEPAAVSVPGFRAVPLTALLDRLPDLHRVYVAVRADVPRGHVSPVPFAEFRSEIEGGLLDADGSVVVLKGDEPVAQSYVLTDREGGRADTDLTGTLAPYRGRGLARLAKTDSLRRLRALGVHSVVTANDEQNEAMRALNERLGFREAAVWTRYAR
jgi:RimJ/RimL family protein N-acetyltransferase/N-acetylglutamate synthase-like GNAT family acetyltransferase